MKTLLNALGIVASLCFFFSGWPAAKATIAAGKSSLPTWTAWLVFLGSIQMLAYIWMTLGFDWIVTLDYLSTIFCWAIVLWYHYSPRKQAPPRKESCSSCVGYRGTLCFWGLAPEEMKPTDYCPSYFPRLGRQLQLNIGDKNGKTTNSN